MIDDSDVMNRKTAKWCFFAVFVVFGVITLSIRSCSGEPEYHVTPAVWEYPQHETPDTTVNHREEIERRIGKAALEIYYSDIEVSSYEDIDTFAQKINDQYYREINVNKPEPILVTPEKRTLIREGKPSGAYKVTGAISALFGFLSICFWWNSCDRYLLRMERKKNEIENQKQAIKHYKKYLDSLKNISQDHDI